MDMRYYWLRDKVRQKQFNVFWVPGINNLADYPTKHHSGAHHRKVRDIYLYDKEKRRARRHRPGTTIVFLLKRVLDAIIVLSHHYYFLKL
jgi:hypothetical protein